MANDVTRNPLVLDTATANILLTKRFTVLKIRWVSEGANAGDNVVLEDQDGNKVWESVAAGADYVESESWPWEKPLGFNGLAPPTLDSGTIYMYVKEGVPL